MSANADLITVETNVQQAKQLITSFSYLGKNVWLFGGPEGGGGFNDHCSILTIIMMYSVYNSTVLNHQLLSYYLLAHTAPAGSVRGNQAKT